MEETFCESRVVARVTRVRTRIWINLSCLYMHADLVDDDALQREVHLADSQDQDIRVCA